MTHDSQAVDYSGTTLDKVETTFRQLLEAAPDAAVVSDRSGRILLVNHMTERLLGYGRDELIGQTIEVLVPERYRAGHAHNREQYHHSPSPRYMGEGRELFALCKDGRELPVEISLSPMEIDGVPLVASAIRDITERKRAEAALRDSEARLHAVLDSTRAIIYMKDAAGKYLQINRRFQELFHVTPEQALGKTDHELFPAELADVFAQHDQTVLAAGQAMEFDEVAHQDDGDHTYMSLKVPLIDSDGKPYALCGVSTDITERKRMEDELGRQAVELERSNAELQQFAYVASHDLQEPLRMVASYAQLLGRRYRDSLDQDANEFIDFMVDGARRMQDLINDLLAFSRVGTRAKPFTPTDTKAVVEQTLRDLRASIEESGAQVEVNGDLPMVVADAAQLGQVFQNLLSNALKFRGNELPRIRITVNPGDGEFVFEVSDNGIGMEGQYAERIFLLFQRLHTKREYPGTGIGLAICKKIVERHGGRIWVDAAPGRGSTFHFTIPYPSSERGSEA
jgi:PAS domain S-box-containing protein